MPYLMCCGCQHNLLTRHYSLGKYGRLRGDVPGLGGPLQDPGAPSVPRHLHPEAGGQARRGGRAARARTCQVHSQVHGHKQPREDVPVLLHGRSDVSGVCAGADLPRS